MFEAYAIGVTLRLNNLVSAQLLLLSKEVKKLDTQFTALGSVIKKIGAESAAIKSMNTALSGTDKRLESAARHASTLERHLMAIRAAGGMGAPLGLPGGGSGGGGGGRRSGGAHGGNIHLGPGGIGIGTVGMAAGNAFVPLALTAAGIWGGHSLYQSAKDLDTEKARFRLYGMSDAVNNDAFRFVDRMKIYGSSTNENMKYFRESQGVFRESGLNDKSALEAAKLATPVLAKIGFLTESLDEESKARLRTSSMAMLRYVEMSGGLKSAKDFNRISDFGWKLTQSSGGNVDWEQLRQFKAISGVAGRHLTDEAMAGLEPLIGELKGGGAGTGLRTSFNRLAGIVKLPNQVAHMLTENGIWDKSKVEWNANGGIKKFNGNPFASAAEFQQNPIKWYESKILPMYDKMKASAEERDRLNGLIFGGTGGRLFSLAGAQLPTIHRSMESIQRQQGIEASDGTARKTLAGQEKEFTAAWTEFKTEFGTAMIPAFVGILRGGASLFRSMNDFVKRGDMVRHAEGQAITPGSSRDILNKTATDMQTWREQQKQLQVTTQINLDSKPIATAVTQHQAKELSRQATGGRRVDPRMTPTILGAH